ncbi:hypothetical protein [Nocardia sp. NPDC050710]|uniref:hypothetical protein n=1 Tax=Nocardia sp. NPDC050710 TaxID=3157220 RepID=UPI0033FD0E69
MATNAIRGRTLTLQINEEGKITEPAPPTSSAGWTAVATSLEVLAGVWSVALILTTAVGVLLLGYRSAQLDREWRALDIDTK